MQVIHPTRCRNVRISRPAQTFPQPVNDDLAEGWKFAVMCLPVPFPQPTLQGCSREVASLDERGLESLQCCPAIILQERRVEIQHVVQFGIKSQVMGNDCSIGFEPGELLDLMRWVCRISREVAISLLFVTVLALP